MTSRKRVRAAREPGLQDCVNDVTFTVSFEFEKLEGVALQRAQEACYHRIDAEPSDSDEEDFKEWALGFYGGAHMTAVKFTNPQKWVDATERFVSFTDRELKQVAFVGESFALVANSEHYFITRKFDAPNGRHFTLQQLIDVVQRFERSVRCLDRDHDSLNPDHCFFEGIRRNTVYSNAEDSSTDQMYQIHWGS